MSDGLMYAGSAMQSGEVTQQIATAVLKQQLDQQEKQAAALVKMISQPAPSLTGTGSTIDILA
jgi:hypothetical protein